MTCQPADADWPHLVEESSSHRAHVDSCNQVVWVRASDRQTRLTRIACLLLQGAMALAPLECVHDSLHPLYAPFFEI